MSGLGDLINEYMSSNANPMTGSTADEFSKGGMKPAQVMADYNKQMEFTRANPGFSTNDPNEKIPGTEGGVDLYHGGGGIVTTGGPSAGARMAASVGKSMSAASSAAAKQKGNSYNAFFSSAQNAMKPAAQSLQGVNGAPAPVLGVQPQIAPSIPTPQNQTPFAMPPPAAPLPMPEQLAVSDYRVKDNIKTPALDKFLSTIYSNLQRKR